MNGHFASVDISLSFGLWVADITYTYVPTRPPSSISRRSPLPRQETRQSPLIHRLTLAADARSTQRVFGGGDGLRQFRREGRLQRRSYPAHHGEKFLAAVRAEIGHTVGRNRIRHHLAPSFCPAGHAGPSRSAVERHRPDTSHGPSRCAL